MIECGSCGIQNPDDLSLCQGCGARLVASELSEVAEAGVAELRSVVQRLVAARLAPGEPIPPAPVGLPVRHDPASTFRLVSLGDDGADDRVYPLPDGPIHLGRAAADLSAADLSFADPFLAPLHARIVADGAHHVLTALERHNGVYRRLRGPAEIVSGDKLLIGQQLLRFEIVPEEERAAPLGIEHGLVVFGSRVRPAWGRLLQLTAAGVPRDVYHLVRAEILLGSERADVVFSDDQLLAPHQARLTVRGNRVILEDLAGGNGTFLALRVPYVLIVGDIIRMGNEVFRYDRA